MNRDFNSDLKAESRIVRLALLFELLIVILSGLYILFIQSIALGWGVLIGLLGIIIGLIGVGSYLWLRYSAQPEVAQGEELSQQLDQLQERIASTLDQVGRLEEERTVLERNEQAELAQRNSLFQEQIAGINEKRLELEITQRQTFQNALRQLQMTHLRDGLLAEKVADANLPEFGPSSQQSELLNHLIDHQIITANDIILDWLKKADLTQEQVNCLLEWRQEIEAKLRATQPVGLPQSEVETIQQEYQAQSSELEQEEVVIKVSSEKDLYEIREAAATQRERNKTTLSVTLSALRGLQEKQKALEKQRMTYASINFPIFTALVFGKALGTKRKSYRVGAGLVHVIVWGLFVVQGGLSIRAAQVIASASSETTLISPTTPITPTSPILSCLPAGTLRQIGIVSRVVDGDTIDVLIDEQIIKVRYIGVDAPEPDQYYGGISMNQNIQLVAGQEVTLIKDVSETDDFGRLLRYVMIGDVFVNYQLVLEGHAQAMAFAPDTACQAVFTEAQTIARSNEIGLWRSFPTSASTSLPEASELESPSEAPCSCAENSLNCADFATHVDAQTCYEYCIQQGAGDIHRLDGNGDGMACESLP